MSASSSGAMRGRPGEVRDLKPSNSGDEPPVPGEYGIGFGDTGDLLKRSPAEPLADYSEGRSLGIRKAHTGGKVGSENPILSCEVFIVQEEFLIDQASDVRQ